jgi:mannose-6-phosphate isomerase-like protein (cupin superfamily)
MSASRSWHVADFNAISPVPCPCGQSRRGLAETQEFPGTIHQVDISIDARLHHHERLTETYYILECGEGAKLQLDDEYLSLRPGMCVVIPPGVRHRAVGRMKILNIVLPKFDPEDEWMD